MQVVIPTLVPNSFQSGRLPVRLIHEQPETIILSLVADFSQATHQLVSIMGRPFLTHRSEDDMVISRSIADDGYWEFAESILLLSLARPGMTVLDVGSNIGYYMALLAPLVGSAGNIYGFEPDEENYRLLLVNAFLTQQWLTNCPQISILRTALTNRVGTAVLAQASGNLGLHHLVSDDYGSAHRTNVSTTTIDALRKTDLLTPKIDLIKADIQGSELSMLQGATATISTDRPILVLEFEPYLFGIEPNEELVNWLSQQGYMQFRVFHSDRRAPLELLTEFTRLLSTDEVRRLLKQGSVGPYGTLIAIHS